MTPRILLALSGLALAGCPGTLDDPQRYVVNRSGSNSECDGIVSALFAESCANNFCHGSTSQLALDLEAPGMPERLINVAGTDRCTGHLIIDPVSPEKSILYTKLTENPSCGDPMPLGALPGTVPTEERDCVLQWIRGALDGGAPPSTPDSSTPPPTRDAGDSGTTTPPEASAPVTPMMPPPLAPRSAWTVSASHSSATEPASRAIDGDIATRWSSGQAQMGGETFDVDFGSEQVFSTLVIDAAESVNDFPAGYEVYVSNDRSAFGAPIASGTGMTRLSISVPMARGRYLRIRQTGTTAESWWSIHEISVAQ